MGKGETKNPCTKVCRFDAAGECLGCFRTKAEVKRWKHLPDEAKAAINQRIQVRGGTVTKGVAKRRKKLDKKIRKLEAKLDALRAERAADPALLRQKRNYFWRKALPYAQAEFVLVASGNRAIA